MKRGWNIRPNPFDAEGGTRTPTSFLTRPSNVRVYQFRHFGSQIFKSYRTRLTKIRGLIQPAGLLVSNFYFFAPPCGLAVTVAGLAAGDAAAPVFAAGAAAPSG